jgi:hypothetical protein
MAEIVLNKKDASTPKIVSMDKDIIIAIISQIALMKLQNLSLHADWSKAPDYCPWLFAELKNKGIQTTVCTNSMPDLSSINSFLDGGTFIELNLSTHHISPVERNSKIRNLRFFLCVDSISQDASLYSEVVDNIPPSAKITLGINWQSRLSGPSAIAEKDYPAWSKTIIAIVEKLSAKKITTQFACGLKLCMFTNQQLGYLPTRLIEWPLSYCSRSLFFDVDGSLRPCMRLTPPDNLSFNHETTLTDASVAFVNWLAPYSGHCLDAEDLNCRSLKTGGCGTGCIEHTFSEWHSEKS